MSFNPFGTVSNYSGMLNKVASATFFASAIALSIIMWQVPAARSGLLPSWTVKVPETDIKVPATIFLGAFAFAFIARIVKLHDRLSDLFGIRKRFDIDAILIPMACATGAAVSLDQQESLKKSRHKLMTDVFYRYASSGPGSAQIDQHTIQMALDQWSWHWVCVEAICVLFLASAVLTWYQRYGAALCLVFVNLLMLWLLQAIREFCRRYARDEIRQILDDASRSTAVRKAFDAL